MKDIFTDLYKKLAGFFQTAPEKENVKEVACNRLKLVLMQDRTNLTPLLLERMRGEMIDVLSKYVEMDKEALELNFEQEGEQMALMLSIPVLRAKDEEEIQAILDEEDAKKLADESEEDSQTDEQETQDEEDSTDADEIAEKDESEDSQEIEDEIKTQEVNSDEQQEPCEQAEENSSKKNKKKN